MSILVFAGKAVGLHCLEYLLENRFPVTHVVVAHETDHDLLDLLSRRGIPHGIFGTKEQVLETLQSQCRFSWLLNLWSPHILTEPLLRVAEHRLNIHPSHAPHCLGSDSATWAIRKNVTPGVSLLEMTREIDTGGIYAQQAVAWEFPEPARALFERLKQASVELFTGSWADIYAGRTIVRPQAGPLSYHTRKMTRVDRRLEGAQKMTLAEVVNWALAHDFAPVSTAEVSLDSGTYDLTITVKKKLPLS